MATEYIMHRYDSIHQFVNAAEKAASQNGSSHRREGDWAGTETFAEAVQHAKYGTWSPGQLVEFRNMFDKFLPKMRTFIDEQFERHTDVAGYEVNMQAYLDGEPENMFQFLPAENSVHKHAVCIIIGHSISGSTSAQELFVRGQAAIALVRALSLLGYELEIYSEETVGRSGRGGAGVAAKWSCVTRLHAAGTPLDESALEFAIGNPAWLRRLLFGLQEGESEKVRAAFGFKEGKGYGTCTPVQHADLVGADVTLDLGRSWFSTYDPKKAAECGMNWVVQQLKDLGVLDEEAVVEWD